MIGSRIGLVAALVAGSGLAVVGQAPRAQATEYVADVVISLCGVLAVLLNLLLPREATATQS